MDFICENAKPDQKIGIDGRILSITNFRRLEKRLADLKVTIDADCDLITGLWNDRPELPFSVAFDHPVKFSGKERSVKISEVREQMKKQNADYHFLTSVDDIMWLLNIRGNDLQYTPLLLSCTDR